jgi:diadenosine tetraphosphate (Ap4A) HIT family hydrolase
MSTPAHDCALCQGIESDDELDRAQVWEDRLWRLTMSRRSPTRAFGYLEPKRHIPHLADLDGEEAQTFGPVLARTCAAIRAASGAHLVYIYVFGGGIPHLHVHIGANEPTGVLSTQIIAGEVEEHPLPSGATEVISIDHPDLPADEVRQVADRVRQILATG